MPKIRDIAKILSKTEQNNPNNTRLLFEGEAGGIDSAATESIVRETPLRVYETLDSLPISDLAAGDQAWVSGNNKLYISNGNGWYNLATTNAAPYWATEPDDEYEITDSATALIITAKAADSDNPDTIITNQSFASDSAEFLVDITRDSSVFTFTPKSQDSIGASVTAGDLTDSAANDFTYTFKWSDGINFVSKAVTIAYNFVTTYFITGTDKAALEAGRTNESSAVVSYNSGNATWTITSGPRWSAFKLANLLSLSGYNSGSEMWSYIRLASMGTTFSTRASAGWYFYEDANGSTALDGVYDAQMFFRSDNGSVNNENNGTNDQEAGFANLGATANLDMLLYYNGDRSAEYWVSTNSGATWSGPMQSHTWTQAPLSIRPHCGRRDDDNSDQSLRVLNAETLTNRPTPSF